VKTFAVDSLEVRQHPDRRTMGRAAAEGVAQIIRDACESRGEARVIFACAPSQDEFLAALVEHEIDWPHVTVFHMDEYAGLGAEHPQSFRRYLREHLLSHVPPPKAFHGIRAEDEQPERECARYAALLADAPIDLVCMGIGENGHIAFNDPPVADFNDPHLIKVVELDAVCRQQQVNDGCFPALAEVPTHALTLTIPALLRPRAVSCVVPGSRKAQAVCDTLRGPISTACPASVLRTHARAVLHIDDAAAAKLGAAE
jgi:glucosamine-6-phosphate deaminase